MPKTLTLTDPRMLGTYDEQYGQTYWSDAEDSNDPVMFNLMEKRAGGLMPGTVVTGAEWVMKTSKKGQDYIQLKKVRVVEDDSEESTKPTLGLDEPTSSRVTLLQPTEDTPSYEAGTNARWATGMAYRAYQQVMGTPEDAAGDFPFDSVLAHAQKLVEIFGLVKDYTPESTAGYDKAKATAKKLKELDTDAANSLLADLADESEA